jgi:hypothetical protein
MNTLKAFLKFLFVLFEESQEWITSDILLKTTPLGHFVGKEVSQVQFEKILVEKVSPHFGSTCVARRGKYHQLSFRLNYLVNVDEGKWIGGLKGREFDSKADIRNYATGNGKRT